MAENKHLEDKIVYFLSRNSSSTALQVAKGVGLHTASEVNPKLYHLERGGRVQKKLSTNDSSKTPLWSISTPSSHGNTSEYSHVIL